MTSKVHDAMLEMLASVNRDELRARIASTVDRLIESYRTVDIDSRVALCARDIVFVDPVGLPEIHGRAEMANFFRACLSEGWNFSMELDELVICADEALMTWIVEIVKDGEGSARLKSSNMMRFDDQGLITSWRAIFDPSRIAGTSAV